MCSVVSFTDSEAPNVALRFSDRLTATYCQCQRFMFSLHSVSVFIVRVCTVVYCLSWSSSNVVIVSDDAGMQEEDRLRRSCDEKCAKVVSEGRCPQKRTSQSPADARATSDASCNGSPTLQRPAGSRMTVDES